MVPTLTGPGIDMQNFTSKPVVVTTSRSDFEATHGLGVFGVCWRPKLGLNA
jgi:hypothetical protein